jgi:DinB superfamily
MPISLDLRSAVLDFVELTRTIPDSQLDIEWQWRGYEEGVRFAHFRVYEELRWLSALLAANAHLSAAQQALIQYHIAYWDLRAVLLNVDDAAIDRSPGEEAWTIRNILPHVIESEWSFSLVNDFALQRARRGETEAVKIPDEAWDPHFVDRGGFSRKIFAGSLQDILDFYDGLHQKVLDILKDISSEELFLLAEFWEPQPMEIAFRLIRYDSHLTQHTIQVEKTLDDLDHHFSEANRLHRRILNALAMVEGICFVQQGEIKDCAETADTLRRLTGEIRPLLQPV